MRLKCPYCLKGFAVYPIPTRQAIAHRKAGWIAVAVQSLLILLFVVVVGPLAIVQTAEWFSRTLTPRLGLGVCFAGFAIPFMFLGLGVYDRLVPHFGSPIGNDMHCTQCGYILKGLTEPRCPECGHAI